MKKLIIFLGLITIVGVQSCSNEFKLTDDWKDITIIYGLMDASDTAQYIRIEKAFLDESTSALLLAQEADSIFYNNVNITLQAISSSGQGGGNVPLQLVDANLEGFQKEDGIFATSPNYVYKVTEQIKPSFRYRLRVEKNDGSPTVEALTDIIGQVAITFPPPPPLTVNFVMNFASGNEQQFRWEPAENAVFYDVSLVMNYREAPLSAPSDFTNKSAEWFLAKNIRREQGDLPNQLFKAVVDGEEFYQWVQSALVEGNFVRELIDFDLYVHAGGEELDNYINAGRASAGLTSAETLPTYTNVENGLGIFSTRYSESIQGIVPADAMVDTLANGPYTKNLGFID